MGPSGADHADTMPNASENKEDEPIMTRSMKKEQNSFSKLKGTSSLKKAFGTQKEYNLDWLGAHMPTVSITGSLQRDIQM